MRPDCPTHARGNRRGVAAVEMAVLAPLLVFLLIITIDFGRVFYFSLTLANCARNGALYQSDPYGQKESPYKSLTEAALADAFNLSDPENLPAVTSTTGQDASGNTFVEVTVSYQFQIITNIPGIPNPVTVTRSVRMPKAPDNPTAS